MTEFEKCNTTPVGNTVVESSRERRRFLGKGAAAVPFVVTLASQPALGVTCFTPSRSLSKNTSVSQQGKDGQCVGALSPATYADNQKLNGGSGYYPWPVSPKPTDPLHAIFYMGNSEGVTKFTKNPGNPVSKTFGEALLVNTSGIHVYLIAAYLNKLGGGGASISDKAITAAGILTMWQEYASKGYYEPFAGVKWYAPEIKNFLTSNGIVG
jgi:hypothetical protein